MRVVKLGGSLNRDPLLHDWLHLLSASAGARIVVVPGGGAFADQVREHQAQWRFDDLTAHNMAVLAMMQSAMMMQGLDAGLTPASTPAGIASVVAGGGVAVWTPADWIRDRPDEMTSWGATSDSLAAWLAGRLGASSLVLVKSCDVEEGASLAEHAAEGVLDAEFCRLTADAAYTIDLLGKTDLPRMRALLLQWSLADPRER